MKRSSASVGLSLVVVAILSGCASPDTTVLDGIDRRVQDYNTVRTRYLDALCPVNAWLASGSTNSGARAEGMQIMRDGEALLVPAPKSWPLPVRAAMEQLRADLARMRDSLSRPDAVPQAPSAEAQRTIEAKIYVSAAVDSNNCTGHPPGTARAVSP